MASTALSFLVVILARLGGGGDSLSHDEACPKRLLLERFARQLLLQGGSRHRRRLWPSVLAAQACGCKAKIGHVARLQPRKHAPAGELGVALPQRLAQCRMLLHLA